MKFVTLIETKAKRQNVRNIKNKTKFKMAAKFLYMNDYLMCGKPLNQLYELIWHLVSAFRD